MLDEYFKRKDVLDFVKELENNPRYLKKSVHEESKYGMQMKDELALYLFYDIIFKYKILINDEYLFPDFLLQVEKLFRKLEHFDDMMMGINKIFINLVSTILDVHEDQSEDARKKIIEYFYQKYIMEGYLVHGYSTTYEEFIKGRNFIPEKYPNHYAKMLRVRQIFAKYKIHVMSKDFQKVSVDFTDDFVMGCHYSITAPGYLNQLFTTCCKDSSSYLKQDYHAVMSSLKRFMNNNSFSFGDQKTILRIVKDEWNFVYRVPRKVSLLFVKRNKVMSVSREKLEEYLESDKSLVEIVERILSPKLNCVSVEQTLKYGEYQIVTLDDFYKNPMLREEKSMDKDFVFAPKMLMNSYGMASILLIVGSL